VHISAKARLTSSAIHIRDPDHHQNLLICSVCPENFMQVCLDFFVCKVANRQTHRQTNNDDYLCPPWRR